MPDVLMVDDDLDGCEPVARAVERWGYRVTRAADGREALAVLVGGRWDAMILDIRMPGMDGLTLLDIVRSYLRWHDLPVIVLTAAASPGHLRQSRDLGVAHVFVKTNYTLPELRAALDALTGGTVAPP